MVLGETIVTGSVAEVTSHPGLVDAYLGASERALSRSGRPAAAGAVPDHTRST